MGAGLNMDAFSIVYGRLPVHLHGSAKDGAMHGRVCRTAYVLVEIYTGYSNLLVVKVVVRSR